MAEYVTTDCILQNKKGREIATNLPPQPCSLIRYLRGVVLIANIRPYLKKVWFADVDGGASPDVLVLRAKNGHSPNYLYAILLQDSFFDYVMQGTKGSKMPRGDKEQILRYEVPTFSCSEESIGTFFLNLDSKIRLNEQINQNLEAMAKQLYDYWFVQFDFPDENGRPYKSSGGKMVWNDQLKREIPIDWHCGNLFEIAVFTNGLACQKFRPKDDEAPLPVIKIREMHDGISADTEEVTPNIPESVKVYNGDVLFSWSASLEVVLWAYGLGGLNQHIFKVTSANDFPKSFYYFQLLDYVDVFKKMAEARKTTMGHITQDHLQQSTIAIPDNKDIADRFEELISPIFRQIIKSQEEILNLTKQRNELLPLLMNGQVSVNSDLIVLYYRELNIRIMKENIIQAIVAKMQRNLDSRQMAQLKTVLASELHNVEIIEKADCLSKQSQEKEHLLNSFISAKKIEGCSDKTLAYYRNTIERLLVALSVAICHITTTDIRSYLSEYQEENQSSKVTIDNMRRIFSSFFAWLEDEDYIAKSPVRRIHKVKTDSLVKEVLSDEQLEQLRDSCTTKRDLAIIDFLSSTGIRVGELVKLNRDDIDFHERQCEVFGKGNKERIVYFNARTKLHLQQYLNARTDNNPALFVSLHSPFTRLTISGVEVRIRKLGQSLSIPKVPPHKFRRTLATIATDKGMPIEQVQRLLGHVRIDTTLHYAIVNQNNVKLVHKKYLG